MGGGRVGGWVVGGGRVLVRDRGVNSSSFIS